MWPVTYTQMHHLSSLISSLSRKCWSCFCFCFTIVCEPNKNISRPTSVSKFIAFHIHTRTHRLLAFHSLSHIPTQHKHHIILKTPEILHFCPNSTGSHSSYWVLVPPATTVTTTARHCIHQSPPHLCATDRTGLCSHMSVFWIIYSGHLCDQNCCTTSV